MASEDPELEEHFTASDTVRDVIIGMSDGLTVPFALAAGLSGAVGNTSLIVIAGLAEIAAGCISMGLGGYLAARSDIEHYESEKGRERRQIQLAPEREQEEVRKIFKSYGLGDAEVQPILDTFEKNPEHWIDFMMQNELGLDKPDEKRASRSGLTIAASYLVGGFVPLTPYMLMHNARVALVISCACTLGALIIFGYVKARLIGDRPWQSAIRTVLLGSIAAAAAYAIAKIFA